MRTTCSVYSGATAGLRRRAARAIEAARGQDGGEATGYTAQRPGSHRRDRLSAHEIISSRSTAARSRPPAGIDYKGPTLAGSLGVRSKPACSSRASPFSLHGSRGRKACPLLLRPANGAKWLLPKPRRCHSRYHNCSISRGGWTHYTTAITRAVSETTSPRSLSHQRHATWIGRRSLSMMLSPHAAGM